jgi:hypothetical protein
VHRLRRAPRQVQIGGSGLDAVGFGPPHGRRPVRGDPGTFERRGNVTDEEGNVVGVEVERDEAVLEVEGSGAVFIMEDALLD